MENFLLAFNKETETSQAGISKGEGDLAQSSHMIQEEGEAEEAFKTTKEIKATRNNRETGGLAQGFNKEMEALQTDISKEQDLAQLRMTQGEGEGGEEGEAGALCLLRTTNQGFSSPLEGPTTLLQAFSKFLRVDSAFSKCLATPAL